MDSGVTVDAGTRDSGMELDGGLACIPPDVLIALDRTLTMHRTADGNTPADDGPGRASTKWSMAITGIEQLVTAKDKKNNPLKPEGRCEGARGRGEAGEVSGRARGVPTAVRLRAEAPCGRTHARSGRHGGAVRSSAPAEAARWEAGGGLLILARAAGLPLSPEEVRVESLVPAELVSLAIDELDGALDLLDAPLAARFEEACRNGGKLRFLGRFDAEGANVGLRALPASHPLCGGSGTDNRVAIFSDRYRDQPLLIQGPGAGAEVTAAALLDDVLGIANG
ncbi:MAG TPA: hypothetical protein PLD19_14335 [Luteimonas sp.]|nr:hypothetical protein [Luteimonas sp.]